MHLLHGVLDRNGDIPPDGDPDIRRSLASLSVHAGGGPVHVRDDGPVLLALAGRRRGPAARVSRHAGGRCLLALDGWLADLDGLRRALGPEAEMAAEAPADGDAGGLLARALLRWGDAALDRLHGQFALAWWDGAERRLLLACDRTGGRTLFLQGGQGGQGGGRLRFSSALGVLLADPAVPRAADPDALALGPCNAFIDDARTGLAGIGNLPAAHKLVATPRAITVERYWRLDPHRRIRLRRDEEYVEAARELLDRAVGDNLPADGPVMSMMSGGLDSAGVTATAARLRAPALVHGLTMRPAPGLPVPADPRIITDEWPLARTIADLHPNLRARPLEADTGPVEDMLRAAMSCLGRPPVHLFSLSWYAPTWRTARAAGAQVLLNGQSGNATLSATALATPHRPGSPADIGGALADAAALFRRTPTRAGLEAALRGLLPAGLREAWHRHRGRAPEWLDSSSLPADTPHAALLARHWRHGGPDDLDAVPFRRRRRLRMMERTWWRAGTHSPLRLMFGVDYRNPLGDVRLAEFCLAIPCDQFTRGREDRWLARRVLADRLPPALLSEGRAGVQNAEWHARMTDLRPWMEAQLDRLDSCASGRELVDLPRLRARLAAWPADADAARPQTRALLRGLSLGVMTGVFLRWAEGGNE